MVYYQSRIKLLVALKACGGGFYGGLFVCYNASFLFSLPLGNLSALFLPQSIAAGCLVLFL